MDSGDGDAVQRASRFADADSQSRTTRADHPTVSKLTGTARSRSRSTVNRPPQLEEDPSVLNTLRKRLQGEEGFTLVELLVVILIIGIIAAIAIPSFLNQKGKGEDAAAKSSAREIATAVETYYTDNAAYAADLSGNDANDLHKIESTLPTQASAAAATLLVSDSAKAGQAFITPN